MHVGLVTDAVKEVLSVPRTQTEPMPPILAGDQRLHEITSVCRLEDGKRLVSIIATERLLHVPQIAQALDATQRAMDEAARSAMARAPTEETETMQTGNMPADNTPADEQDNDDDIQAVIFRLGAEEFGVPIISVQEIVRVPPTLTRVPKTPHFVEGVINLRGTVLPVIDQRARLGLPALERCDGQRIMVYLVGGMRTGFIVDSVAEVLRIPRSDIAPAPVLSGAQSQLITRIANLQRAKRLVMLIDPQRLLDVGEVQAVQEMGSAGGKPQPIEPAPLPLAA
jgi:purine-binding chemotaxis protein CheW